MRRRGAALIADERGTQLIEFLGFFPLVLLALMIAWQLLLVGYTGVTASGAAREGARAASVGEDVTGAVRGASPSFGAVNWSYRSAPCTGFARGSVTVEVRLEVPRAPLPLIGSLPSAPEVFARATYRCEAFRMF